KLSLSDFNKSLEVGKIKELAIMRKSGAGVYYVTGKMNDYSKNESFEIVMPLTDSVVDDILGAAKEQDIKVETKNNSENNTWVS
ncbi:MAG: hypothetical protein RR325_05680, partial [Bacilli bacterium]